MLVNVRPGELLHSVKLLIIRHFLGFKESAMEKRSISGLLRAGPIVGVFQIVEGSGILEEELPPSTRFCCAASVT
jgi:hypothetical protein